MISRARLGGLVREHLVGRGVAVEPTSSALVPTTFDGARDLGALLAQVHRALDDLVLADADDPSMWTVSPTALAGADDGWLRRSLHGSDEALAVLLPWREEALARLPVDGRPDGLCHGEAYPAACRMTPSGDLAVSELDWVAPGWREYDLATFLWAVAVRDLDEAIRRFDELLAGYATHATPPTSDALRAWVAARHLWSMRLAAGFEGRTAHRRRAEFALAWPLP